MTVASISLYLHCQYSPQAMPQNHLASESLTNIMFHSTCKNLIYPLVFTKLQHKTLRHISEKRATRLHTQKVDISEAIKYTASSLQSNKSTCLRTLTNEQGTTVLPCEITDPTVK